jgi:hypothetical protein
LPRLQPPLPASSQVEPPIEKKPPGILPPTPPLTHTSAKETVGNSIADTTSVNNNIFIFLSIFLFTLLNLFFYKYLTKDFLIYLNFIFNYSIYIIPLSKNIPIDLLRNKLRQ